MTPSPVYNCPCIPISNPLNHPPNHPHPHTDKKLQSSLPTKEKKPQQDIKETKNNRSGENKTTLVPQIDHIKTPKYIPLKHK